MTVGPPVAVYLSPHFDDVVLSCGGALARAAEAGQPVLVVTIFGGEMPAGLVLGKHIRGFHAASGNVPNLVATRRLEDAAAFALLHASSRYLLHPDAAYRPLASGRPLEARDLRRERSADDQAIVAATIDDLGSTLPRGCVIHAPLGIGNHIDHQMTAEIARGVAQRLDAALTWYEDLPYAARTGGSEVAKATAGCTPIVHDLSDAQLARKLEAVAAHATQVRMLFGSEKAMQRELTRYAQRMGGGRPAEREWTEA